MPAFGAPFLFKKESVHGKKTILKRNFQRFDAGIHPADERKKKAGDGGSNDPFPNEHGKSVNGKTERFRESAQGYSKRRTKSNYGRDEKSRND